MQKRIIAGAAVAIAMLPLLASAQTTDVQAQVQSLLSQIQALQLQLKNLLASSTTSIKANFEGRMPPGQISKAMCIQLARNLRHGLQGDDVRALQEMLREDKESGFNAEATGFFGPLTARAIAKWQMRMGIASTSDGSVGPLTRGFFERRCGKGLGNSGPGSVQRANVAGEITAVASSSITVKGDKDGTRVVHITASTTIHVFASATSSPTVGSMDDLDVGKRVSAAGIKNADGSISAHMVRVGVHARLAPPLIEKVEKTLKKIFKFDHRGKKISDDDKDEDDEDEDVD